MVKLKLVIYTFSMVNFLTWCTNKEKIRVCYEAIDGPIHPSELSVAQWQRTKSKGLVSSSIWVTQRFFAPCIWKNEENRAPCIYCQEVWGPLCSRSESILTLFIWQLGAIVQPGVVAEPRMVSQPRVVALPGVDF